MCSRRPWDPSTRLWADQLASDCGRSSSRRSGCGLPGIVVLPRSSGFRRREAAGSPLCSLAAAVHDPPCPCELRDCTCVWPVVNAMPWSVVPCRGSGSGQRCRAAAPGAASAQEAASRLSSAACSSQVSASCSLPSRRTNAAFTNGLCGSEATVRSGLLLPGRLVGCIGGAVLLQADQQAGQCAAFPSLPRAIPRRSKTTA